jgi:hypothetical protein
MEKIEHKRNYIPIIILSIWSIVFLIYKHNLDSQLYNFFVGQNMNYNYQGDHLATEYCVLLFFSIFTIVALTLKTIIKLKNIIIWLLYLGWLIWILFPFIESVLAKGTLVLVYQFDKTFYYSSHLQFIAFLILLIDIVKGEEVNVYPIINQNKTATGKNSLKELQKLRDKNILNEEEFIQKSNKVKEEKIIFDLQFSEDYKNLESLKNKKILSNDEFDDKIKALINSKLKE